MSPQLCIRDFSLKETLDSGQFFRFTKIDGTYIVQSSNRIFSLYQRGDFLFYEGEGVDVPFLTDFFRLDEDLGTMLKEIDRDPVIHRAIEAYHGMRLIRQDPWECLLSFICSSAKAIPHIRLIIECLCKSAGKKIRLGNYIGYGFPEPRCIDDALQLEKVKAGFRTKYIVEVNRSIDRNQLLALKSLSYEEARRALMGLSGVGKKVADCVLLYSLDFLQAFPIDTWIKRGLKKVYFHGKKIGEKAMEQFVSNHFGPLAGYAQLYLYHFWRNHPF